MSDTVLLIFQEIKLQYERFTQANKANSESLVLAMISAYKDRVSKLTGGPKMKCLPPSKFHDDDDEIRETINQMYHARRTVGSDHRRHKYDISDEDDDSGWEEIKQVTRPNQHISKLDSPTIISYVTIRSTHSPAAFNS